MVRAPQISASFHPTIHVVQGVGLAPSRIMHIYGVLVPHHELRQCLSVDGGAMEPQGKTFVVLYFPFTHVYPFD